MKLASLAAEVHGNHDQVIQDHNETSQVPGDPDFPATKDHKGSQSKATTGAPVRTELASLVRFYTCNIIL